MATPTAATSILRRQRCPSASHGPSSKTTVVLFGDSHAMQWFPALNGLAKEHDWRLVGLTKAACPPELEKEILPYYEQAAEEPVHAGLWGP